MISQPCIDTINKGKKNPYISIAKLITSCFIVIGHIKFSGVKGNILECIARFGVPFFFAVSGFYSFHTNAYKLPKRIKKLIAILIITDIIYVCWGYYYNTITDHLNLREYLSSLISIKKIALFFFLDMRTSCMTFHMWFITAEIKVYAALFLYLVFTNNKYNYKPLYYLAAASFMFFIAFGLNSLATGYQFEPSLTRNSLFYAFPMFVLGIFLHNYIDVIIQRFHLTKMKLSIMILCGFLCSILELLGIGRTEMPLGMLLAASSVILLSAGFPLPSDLHLNKLAPYLNDIEAMSLIIYIIHPLFHLIFRAFNIFVFSPMYPLYVLAASILVSLLYCCVKRIIHLAKRRRLPA